MEDNQVLPKYSVYNPQTKRDLNTNIRDNTAVRYMEDIHYNAKAPQRYWGMQPITIETSLKQEVTAPFRGLAAGFSQLGIGVAEKLTRLKRESTAYDAEFQKQLEAGN